tara:strand:- start:59 stop:175 length:117 start_codon:yes stop_codon:yes gene_type:complete
VEYLVQILVLWDQLVLAAATVNVSVKQLTGPNQARRRL